jgi:hypothetical protein
VVLTTWALSFDIQWSLVGFVIFNSEIWALIFNELHGCCGFNSELWVSIFNEALWFWVSAMNFDHQKLWIQNMVSMEVEHWQRLQQVSIVASFIQVSTNNGASTMRSSDNSYNFDNEKFQQQPQL